MDTRKYIFTKNRLTDEPDTAPMTFDETVREMGIRCYGFTQKRREKILATLEVGQVLSWFCVIRIS